MTNDNPLYKSDANEVLKALGMAECDDTWGYLITLREFAMIVRHETLHQWARAYVKPEE